MPGDPEICYGERRKTEEGGRVSRFHPSRKEIRCYVNPRSDFNNKINWSGEQYFVFNFLRSDFDHGRLDRHSFMSRVDALFPAKSNLLMTLWYIGGTEWVSPPPSSDWESRPPHFQLCSTPSSYANSSLPHPLPEYPPLMNCLSGRRRSDERLTRPHIRTSLALHSDVWIKRFLFSSPKDILNVCKFAPNIFAVNGGVVEFHTLFCETAPFAFSCRSADPLFLFPLFLTLLTLPSKVFALLQVGKR